MTPDLRQALRRLRETPGFTFIAVLTLALGIGANTAIFTLVNKMLLQPLPVKEPSEIVAVNNTSKGRTFPTFSYLNYKDLRDRTATTAELVAYAPSPVSLSHDGVNERVWGYIVSGNYFEALGVRAALGRTIQPSDDAAPGAHPVAVISHDSWKRRFGGDPEVAGRDIVVNGRPFTIIGVAPPGFIGIEVAFVAEMWFPLMMQSEIRPGRQWLEARGMENLYVAARLNPGTKMAQARTALRRSGEELEREYPADNVGKTIELSSAGLFGSMGAGPMMGFSAMLMALVGLVLLLVCTNLANLCLARSTHRRREIALRQALGATRWRIVRQELTESLLLSVAGGGIGVMLAWWLTRAATRFRPPIDLPLLPSLDMDGRVLLFAFGLSLVTSVVFGFLPAWRSTNPDSASMIKEDDSAGPRGSRLRNCLAAAQVGLSLVLMICAGLVLRSLQRAEQVDLGMNPQNAVELAFDLTLQGYTVERGLQFQRSLLERVRALPGVEAAGAGSSVQPDLHIPLIRLRIDGSEPVSDAEAPRAGFATVSPDYFAAIGTRLIAGRDFEHRDVIGSPRVAIVNQTMGRRFWNGENPIGKRLSLSILNDSWLDIVGVVEDGKYRSLSEEPGAFVFVPLGQNYTGLTKVVARTSGGTGNLLDGIRREVENLDPNLPVFDAQTLAEHMRLPLFPARLAAVVLGSFGSLALVLAALGVFGVVSFTVSRRTREIGVRIALGASRADILKLVIRQGMLPVIAGMALGLICSLALTQLLEEFLFDVSSKDPATFGMIAIVLGAVALVACYLPARRALQISPTAALQSH